MKYSRIAAIIACAASTTACATTQKIGNGVVTIVKAPIDIADAALTGTERVLNVADKAVSIAYKTRAVISGVPGADPLAGINTIKAQTSAMRWALGGLDNAERAATTVSYASSGRNFVSSTSSPVNQTRAAASYVPAQRAYTPATNQYVKSRTPQTTTRISGSKQFASNTRSTARSYTAPPPAPSYTPTPPAPRYTPTATSRTYTSNSAISHSRSYTNTGQTYRSNTYSSRPSMTYSSSGSRVKSASSTYSTHHR